MSAPGTALNVALQGLQQAALAGMAQLEVGAAAQVFLQLPTGATDGQLQRALAQAGRPQTGGNQQRQRHQRLGEVLEQQAEQIIAVGAVEQGDLAVLGQVPEQPGIVVIANVGVLPNPVIGQYGEQAFALIELQHVGAVGA